MTSNFNLKFVESYWQMSAFKEYLIEVDTMGVLLGRSHTLMKLIERRDWFLQKNTYPKKVSDRMISYLQIRVNIMYQTKLKSKIYYDRKQWLENMKIEDGFYLLKGLHMNFDG